MTTKRQDILRQLPQTGRVLGWEAVAGLLATTPRQLVVEAVQTVLERLRRQVLEGTRDSVPGDDELQELVGVELRMAGQASLRRVINASGVVIHTNLGRAPLAAEAVQAIAETAAGYSNLEYDLARGERGSRQVHVEELLCRLTGAEAALVVNNNAAAVILALSTLAAGREVIVSRGELVEIGGAFRIPDVMERSGARLVEVGTTNRTHRRDYMAAMGGETALLLKVHTSNYAVVGFTAEVGVAELAEAGRQAEVPLLVDAGSGCLVDLTPFGIAGEPTIRQYLEAGAGLVTFSGDKLLGGPQAGIIVGRRALVEPMRRNPLLRAMRMDKLGVAALEATLRLYRDERQAVARIPTLRMLCMSPEELQERAVRLRRFLRRRLGTAVGLTLRRGESSVGGGAFPLLQLPTTLIEVAVPGRTCGGIEALLRRAAVPVVGRIRNDSFLLDVRTVMDQDLPDLARSLATITTGSEEAAP